jgi:hypothetical protein
MTIKKQLYFEIAIKTNISESRAKCAGEFFTNNAG